MNARHLEARSALRLAFTDGSAGIFLSSGEQPPYHLTERSIDGNWRDVFLPRTFADPVVIAGVPSRNGGHPGVVRLRDVGRDSLRLRFQEWSYLDGWHKEERLGLLAVEAGRHVMADGSIWEAGSFALGGTRDWQTESFTEAFPGAPAVFLTVQSFEGAEPVTVRARQVTAGGFRAALFEEEASAGEHAVERVGYLAVYSPASSGSIAGGAAGTPYLLQSRSLTSRFRAVLSSAVRLEEERSLDDETDHESEQVAVLALGRQLFGQVVSHHGRDTVALRRRAPAAGSALEWGFVDGITHDWTTLPLARRFHDPVVVAKPVSSHGRQPGVVRLRAADGQGFDLRFQEWSYLNDRHRAEGLFYMIAESGVSEVADLAVEAGRLDSATTLGEGFETVVFDGAFAEPPAVFAGVMSANDPAPVTSRTDGVTASDFLLALSEEEAATDGHGTETLGWIAIAPGSGRTVDGRRVEVGFTTAGSQATETAFGFSPQVVVADVVSVFEADPVTLRYGTLQRALIELSLQEEKSLDRETSHGFEDIATFAAR